LQKIYLLLKDIKQADIKGHIKKRKKNNQ